MNRNEDQGVRVCSICQKPTAYATLAQYGASCYFCFQAYCSQGIKGGAAGFMGGANDTPDQAIMRRALKANRPVGQSVAASDVLDDKAIAAAKRDTARRVAEYERRHP